MLASGDVLRIVLSIDEPETVLANLVWHYLVTSGSGGDEATALAAIDTMLQSAFGNINGDIFSLVTSSDLDMLKRDVPNHRWDGVASQASTAVNGLSGSHLLPHGTGPLVKFFTETGRRQGRKYIPGYTEASQAGSVMDAAHVTRLISFAQVFNDDIIAGPVTLGPGNYNTDALSVLYETFAEWSNTSSISTIASYQRRRKPGVGI